MERAAVSVLCLSAFASAPVWADEADGGYHFNRADSFLARVEALAVLQTLDAQLLSHDSATATLELWCTEHHLSSEPKVVAVRVAGIQRGASAQVRADLHARADELVRYRRVELRCGGVTVSEADNWYLPSQLSAEMNSALERSDTPFGKVVQTLRFQRHVLSAELLWHPLPDGWEMGAAPRVVSEAPLAIPHSVLRHRAVLSLSDGTPFSEVVETYTGAVLSFANVAP